MVFAVLWSLGAAIAPAAFGVDIVDPLFRRGDSNGDGALDISDPIYTLQFLFTGGQAPPAPYPDCGVARTPAALPVCLETCAN